MSKVNRNEVEKEIVDPFLDRVKEIPNQYIQGALRLYFMKNTGCPPDAKNKKAITNYVFSNFEFARLWYYFLTRSKNSQKLDEVTNSLLTLLCSGGPKYRASEGNIYCNGTILEPPIFGEDMTVNFPKVKVKVVEVQNGAAKTESTKEAAATFRRETPQRKNVVENDNKLSYFILVPQILALWMVFIVAYLGINPIRYYVFLHLALVLIMYSLYMLNTRKNCPSQLLEKLWNWLGNLPFLIKLFQKVTK